MVGSIDGGGVWIAKWLDAAQDGSVMSATMIAFPSQAFAMAAGWT